MDLNIDDLIISPGQFVIEPGKGFKVAGGVEGEKLNIFSDTAIAAKVYKAYATCHNNAVALIADAELLYGAGRFPRACALAIIAWEELGKSQIAADYYSGMLTEAEYKPAFKEHRLKTSYLNRAGAIDGQPFLTVAYNTTIGHRLEEVRQVALYASADNDPSEEITKENARDIIDRVNEHINYIRYAEELGNSARHRAECRYWSDSATRRRGLRVQNAR
jgi:AbiV family abortive infection protein